MVPVVMRAAALLDDEGIDAEVLDLRSLSPLDTDAIIESVRKTGGLVTVHESWTAYESGQKWRGGG